ncbi:hypothetical protein EJD97_025199 [Solanum chilense]|uniref:Reverse transcriptase/retrotransposon-derived protein RNase H-like domain-containing protein n=1 Tax=Solanum chilense TaxID=4083 RepID=A0A6N2C8H5_SOLCI|nr:hypothetical protein EJD97_025199 [Solanum chilense]
MSSGLLSESKKFKWSEASERSFKILKDRLTSALELTLLEGTKGFVVCFDASRLGLGCVLMQHGKVVPYASRQLKDFYMSVLYNLGKANVVVDALNWLSMCSVSHIDKAKEYLVKDVDRNRLLEILMIHSRRGDSVLSYKGRFVVPNMNHDLREVFLLEDLKKDIVEFVSKYSNCQQVKAKNQKSGFPRKQKQYDSIWLLVDRLTKSANFIPIRSTYSAEDYARIFIDEIMLQYNSFHSSIYMSHYEALYGRRYRSPFGCFELGDPSVLCPDTIYKTLEKVHTIRNQLQMAYSRKKSYVDHRKSDLKFEEAYKCITDPESILPLEGLGVTDNLSNEEVSSQILDRQVNMLRNKEVASIKVLWKNHLVEVQHGRVRPA